MLELLIRVLIALTALPLLGIAIGIAGKGKGVIKSEETWNEKLILLSIGGFYVCVIFGVITWIICLAIHIPISI